MENQQQIVNVTALADHALNCSDYPVLRMVIAECADPKKELFNGKSKEMVVAELDTIRTSIEQLAKREEEQLKKEYINLRTIYSLIYHKIASETEQDIQKFQIKYPQTNKLVAEQVADLRLQLRNLDAKLETLESYGNRRKNIIPDLALSDDLEWSPYEQTFSFIWKNYTEQEEKEGPSKKVKTPTKKKQVGRRKKIPSKIPEDPELSYIDDETELLDKKKIKRLRESK